MENADQATGQDDEEYSASTFVVYTYPNRAGAGRDMRPFSRP